MPKPPTSASASASAQAAASLPPLCPALCKRVVACFQEEMAGDGDVSPEIREVMLRSMKRGEERCVERCEEQSRDKGETFEKEARACIAKKECDETTECMRILNAQ